MGDNATSPIEQFQAGTGNTPDLLRDGPVQYGAKRVLTADCPDRVGDPLGFHAMPGQAGFAVAGNRGERY